MRRDVEGAREATNSVEENFGSGVKFCLLHSRRTPSRPADTEYHFFTQ